MSGIEKLVVKASTSRHERETAIRVLMKSKIVRNWVTSQANFLEIEPGTPKWDEFYKREARKYAKNLISE